MRASDGLGSLALMATASNLHIYVIITAWLLAACLMFGGRIIRKLKGIGR